MTANTSNTEPHKLETTFDGDDVIHTVYRPDPAAEGGEVKDQTKWKQKKIIGQGAFGEVTLQEEEGREKFRAVKKLSRQARNVNWSQELDTLAGLREVSNSPVYISVPGANASPPASVFICTVPWMVREPRLHFLCNGVRRAR